MNNTDYIKEKLNTIRVEFMAKIFIIIAIGSGLSKLILNTTQNIHNDQQFMFNIGLTICLILLLLVIYDLFRLSKLTNKLKKD